MVELSIGNARILQYTDAGIEVINGVIYIENGKIKEIKQYGDFEIDAEGRCVIPGLIDPHTHLIFAGKRTDEFEKRLKGKSYEEIAKEGGGIFSTVKKTRKASFEELYEEARKRLLVLLKRGVTVVEIKSGYGLDYENELKILKVIKRLKENCPQAIFSTFLGAHAFPNNMKREDYVKLLIENIIPSVKDYAEFADVFCDVIAFTPDEARRILLEAKRHGMKPKIHADELSYSRGAEVAAELNAVSADHLLYSSKDGLLRMKERGVVPVLLPSTSFFLDKRKKPEIEFMRENNIHFAVGSDFNPGSSPYLSPFIVMHIGCIYYGLTPEEVIKGMTINAAKALGIGKEKGSIAKGKDADLVILDTDNYIDMIYMPENDWVWKVIIKGELVYERGNS